MYERGIQELTDIKYRILHLLPFSSLLSISTFLLYGIFRLKYLVTSSNPNAESGDVFNSTLYFIAELGLLSQYIPYSQPGPGAFPLTVCSSGVPESPPALSVLLRSTQSPAAQADQ